MKAVDATIVVRLPTTECPCEGTVYYDGVSATAKQEKLLLCAVAHRLAMSDEDDEALKMLAAALLAHLSGKITIVAAELAPLLPKNGLVH